MTSSNCELFKESAFWPKRRNGRNERITKKYLGAVFKAANIGYLFNLKYR